MIHYIDHKYILIHIIFHGITAHYKLKYLIRDDVVKILNNSEHFKTFSNSVDKIIDKAIINTNCWLLPGSRKKRWSII